MSARQLRRTLLKTAAAAAFLGASAAVLPMFSTPSRRQTPQSCPSTDLSGSEKELSISSWPAYVDPVDDPDSTLHGFERQTGITVHLTEDITDAQLFFAKVLNQLGACQPVNRDLMILNNPLAARMIALGWLQELDHSAMPNVTANLLPGLRQTVFDPGRRYCLPWQSGFTGIAYNAALVPEVGSVGELLTRDDLRGRITLLSDMEDTMPFMLRLVGADPSRFDDDDWHSAIELLVSTRRRGQIKAFNGSEFRGDLVAGNIASCLAWSGDVAQLQLDNPDIRFVAPEEGLVLWCDNLMIPNRARHKANAEKWINHYYDPEVAARLAAYVYGICPVAGAREAMQGIAPALADNP
ncbi:MAG: spermidine/putrescine ABC transporter substrate-binding protein [Gammaproteobacteria bacterium]|nr:spermidine/putrescine ABC transporter substrate-binding protein [Gammaproteobacteria bacterium]